MINVIKIDKSVDVPFSLSRGQIMRFDFWAKDDECGYNDEAFVNFAYERTPKSVFQTLDLESGLTKIEDGKFHAEFDSSIVRSCYDVVYGEFFPYGTGYKSMTFIIGINNSTFN